MYYYKKQSKFGLILIIIGLSIVCFVGGYFGGKYVLSLNAQNKEEAINSSNTLESPIPYTTDEPETTAPPAIDYKYLVREYNGRVGVFSAPNLTTPQFIITVPLSELPEADRALLKQGIQIKSEAELASIIEDYSS